VKTLIAIAALVVLGACHTVPTEAPRATAALKPTTGNKTFGEANFEQLADNKVRVSVYVQGLKPGAEHGLHIHEKGDCSSGDGMSTGGHFNPASKPHGHYQAPEHHAGDLPSLKAGKNGRARIDVELSGLTVAPGASSVIGRGIIVHADPDDYKTQPTGNAGARIACGVITAS
jgi:superoxide dismutase, Cu-Zn family